MTAMPHEPEIFNDGNAYGIDVQLFPDHVRLTWREDDKEPHTYSCFEFEPEEFKALADNAGDAHMAMLGLELHEIQAAAVEPGDTLVGLDSPFVLKEADLKGDEVVFCFQTEDETVIYISGEKLVTVTRAIQ